MKAISLWQPWSSLWLTPAKIHETRHWSTSHRGPLLVHAAKNLVSACGENVDEICIREFGTDWRRTLPRGALLGVVDLVDCRSAGDLDPALTLNDPIKYLEDDQICGDFSPGRFAWQRGRFAAFKVPVLWKGRQGFFDVDSEAVRDEVYRLLQIKFEGEAA